MNPTFHFKIGGLPYKLLFLLRTHWMFWTAIPTILITFRFSFLSRKALHNPRWEPVCSIWLGTHIIFPTFALAFIIFFAFNFITMRRFRLSQFHFKISWSTINAIVNWMHLMCGGIKYFSLTRAHAIWSTKKNLTKLTLDRHWTHYADRKGKSWTFSPFASHQFCCSD